MSGPATHADVAGFGRFLNVLIDTRPPHQTAAYGFHADDSRVCVVQFFQQCLAVGTWNNHSCAPHETTIMDAEFISSLSVRLQEFVVVMIWKSIPRPDEDL